METREFLTGTRQEAPDIRISEDVAELQIENDNLRSDNKKLRNEIKSLKQVNFTQELEGVLQDAAQAKQEVIAKIVSEKEESEKKILHLMRLLKEAKYDHNKLTKRVAKVTRDLQAERKLRVELEEKMQIQNEVFKRGLTKKVCIHIFQLNIDKAKT